MSTNEVLIAIVAGFVASLLGGGPGAWTLVLFFHAVRKTAHEGAAKRIKKWLN